MTRALAQDLRVLLVEDDPENRCVIELALGRDPTIDIISFDNAFDAYDHALGSDLDFDVVMIDVLLPDGNGIDLIDRLREVGSTWDATMIVVTAFIPSRGVSQYLEAGADDVVMKPFDATRLVDSVRGSVRRAQCRPDDIGGDVPALARRRSGGAAPLTGAIIRTVVPFRAPVRGWRTTH